MKRFAIGTGLFFANWAGSTLMYALTYFFVTHETVNLEKYALCGFTYSLGWISAWRIYTSKPKTAQDAKLTVSYGDN